MINFKIMKKEDLRKVIMQREGENPKNGYFHGWGTKEPFTDVIVSCAIVELMDGTVQTPAPYDIRFVESF